MSYRKVYHVRPVTQTDVVRAGTRDVAKIFQILYDVNAVSGPGAVTYLGAYSDQAIAAAFSNTSLSTTAVANNTTTTTLNSMASASTSSTSSGKKGSGGMLHASTLESSPSIYSTSSILSANKNTTAADLTYSMMDNTLVGINGPLNLDDYSTRSDAISVGSNDSGDVVTLYFYLFIFYWLLFIAVYLLET